MGNCGGKQSDVPPEERERNKQIEKELAAVKSAMDREVKLLLLGAGESGKSTIAKQMRIIYLTGFGDQERLHYKEIIHSNLITSMSALISAAKKFQYQLQNEHRQEAEELAEATVKPSEIQPSLANMLRALWRDPAIQKALERQSEFQLYDSTEYFYRDFDRITKSDYVPTNDDILRSRAKTTGIAETEFDVEGVHFRMVDVGGQRSERKKWIHCFQDVTAVVFCVAMSEYDLKLYEDETVPRMDESLKLFDEICNSKWFVDTSIILFLNKSDIFREKIKKVDLTVCFPNYKGGLNYDKAAAYMQRQFVKLNKSPKRKEIYCHITCATDTGNIQYVFNVVKDIVIKKALLKEGLGPM